MQSKGTGRASEEFRSNRHYFWNRLGLTLTLMLCYTLLLMSAAVGEFYPTNPNRGRALQLERMDRMSRRLLQSYWQKDFSLEVITEPTYTTQGEYRIVPEIEGNFSYTVQIYDASLGNEDRLLYSMRINGLTFTLPPLVMPATYDVTLFCTNLDNNEDSRSAVARFTLAPDS